MELWCIGSRNNEVLVEFYHLMYMYFGWRFYDFLLHTLDGWKVRKRVLVKD